MLTRATAHTPRAQSRPPPPFFPLGPPPLLSLSSHIPAAASQSRHRTGPGQLTRASLACRSLERHEREKETVRVRTSIRVDGVHRGCSRRRSGTLPDVYRPAQQHSTGQLAARAPFPSLRTRSYRERQLDRRGRASRRTPFLQAFPFEPGCSATLHPTQQGPRLQHRGFRLRST